MKLSIHEWRVKSLCLIVFILWFYLLIYKYYAFGYYDWDLSFSAQAMWSLTHGFSYVSLFDKDFFGNHANLIAFLLVPLYKVFPHPLTLLILKLASFMVSSYVLYLLAKEKLGERIALLILWFYWIYPANIYGLVYEFDFENLAPAFLMFMFYFYIHEKWMAFMINGILLLLLKENMPLIVMAFGIYGFFTRADKIRWGLIPVLMGGISFYVLAFVFVPLMDRHIIGHHPYISHYADIVQSPGQLLSSMVTFEKLKWFGNLLGPLMFLPILAPGVLLLVFPIILQHLLSAAPQEQSIYFAYTLTIAPFVFLAFINALVRIKEKFPKFLFFFVLSLTIVTSAFDLVRQSGSIKDRYMLFNIVKYAPQRWQIIKAIPRQAPVIASFNFLPELSQRPYVYSFYKMYDYAYQDERGPYTFPQNTQYALIDFNDSYLRGALLGNYDFTMQHVKGFLALGWVVEKRYGSVVLYKRKK